jgi:NAD(P)-dependent dehydrogenase (short-subunit alcohol dehydrogenase family)
MLTRYVITGATSGLGWETVRQLSQDPQVELILGIRGESRAAELRARVEAAGPARATVLPLDLASLESIRTFASLVSGRIDGIICNAGLQFTTGAERTVDKLETTFQVNHLSHFLLVNLLFEQLREGGRVIFIGSGTHDPEDKGARRFGFRGAQFRSAEDVAYGRGEPGASPLQLGQDFYATSKLCNIMTAYEWARRVPASRAGFFVVDPGLMPGTGLARDRGSVQKLLWRTLLPGIAKLMPGASTPARSAEAVIWALQSPELDGKSGLNFGFTRQQEATSKDSYKVDLAVDLFETSLRLVGLSQSSTDPEYVDAPNQNNQGVPRRR